MSYLNRDDISVKNVVLLKSATMLARATVIFFEVIETHGWKVLKSKKMHERFGEELWIQAPSYKRKWIGNQNENKDPWHETVYINDQRTRDLVEGMIYDAYHIKVTSIQNRESMTKEENKNNLSTIETLEEVNPEDIPF